MITRKFIKYLFYILLIISISNTYSCSTEVVEPKLTEDLNEESNLDYRIMLSNEENHFAAPNSIISNQLVDSLLFFSDSIPSRLGEKVLQKYLEYKIIDTSLFKLYSSFFKFGKVMKLDSNYFILLIGVNFDESLYHITLFSQINNKWYIKQYRKEYSRYSFSEKHYSSNAGSKVFHLKVSQTWSSDGDYSEIMLYKVTQDSFHQCLILNSLMIEWLELDKIENEVNWSILKHSNIDSLKFFSDTIKVYSKNELSLQFAFKNQSIELKILSSPESVLYCYDKKKRIYIPNWNSLTSLTKEQYLSLNTHAIDLDVLNPFKDEIKYTLDRNNKIPNLIKREINSLIK